MLLYGVYGTRASVIRCDLCSQLKGFPQRGKRDYKYRRDEEEHVRDDLVESHLGLVQARGVVLLPAEFREVRLVACAFRHRRAVHLHEVHCLRFRWSGETERCQSEVSCIDILLVKRTMFYYW